MPTCFSLVQTTCLSELAFKQKRKKSVMPEFHGCCGICCLNDLVHSKGTVGIFSGSSTASSCMTKSDHGQPDPDWLSWPLFHECSPWDCLPLQNGRTVGSLRFGEGVEPNLNSSPENQSAWKFMSTQENFWQHSKLFFGQLWQKTNLVLFENSPYSEV